MDAASDARRGNRKGFDVDLGLLRRIVVDLLLLPPGSIVVALLLGLLISKRWPRTGRAVLWKIGRAHV